MPTERFLNLSEDKKKRIRQAALQEFSRVSFQEVSINQIVKVAGISRGSFYTYFDDKMDLLRYLMEDMWENSKMVVLRSLEVEKGDLYKAAEKLIEHLIDRGPEQKNYAFYKNTLSDMNIMTNMEAFERGKDIFQSEAFVRFGEQCLDKIDQKQYKIHDIKTFIYMFDLIVAMVGKSMMQYYVKGKSKEDIMNTIHAQLDFIRYGTMQK